MPLNFAQTLQRRKPVEVADPERFARLIDILVEASARHLIAQINAGVQAVQIFDSWAGILSPADFERYALRWAKHMIAKVRAHPASAGAPIIYFVNGCAPYLKAYATSGADVLGVDWRIDLDTVRAVVGDGVALQGNLDPGALFASPDELRRRVLEVLARGGPVGHVFNLGHGVQPDTDPGHVRVMVETVQQHVRAP